MVFDAESKSVLHTEMAKKNLFVKRGRGLRFPSYVYGSLHTIHALCGIRHIIT